MKLIDKHYGKLLVIGAALAFTTTLWAMDCRECLSGNDVFILVQLASLLSLTGGVLGLYRWLFEENCASESRD